MVARLEGGGGFLFPVSGRLLFHTSLPQRPCSCFLVLCCCVVVLVYVVHSLRGLLIVLFFWCFVVVFILFG